MALRFIGQLQSQGGEVINNYTTAIPFTLPSGVGGYRQVALQAVTGSSDYYIRDGQGISTEAMIGDARTVGAIVFKYPTPLDALSVLTVDASPITISVFEVVGPQGLSSSLDSWS